MVTGIQLWSGTKLDSGLGQQGHPEVMGEQLWLGRGHPRMFHICPSWWWKLL